MINNKKILLILFGIVITAFLLRFWQLGIVPPSPDWDEAALGYNAYSIIHTGRDEFGKFLPVVLRSFDDYKPALYAYLAIPSILIFGLNTFAVRLPSALFGIVSVIAVFFLVKELFEKYKYRDYLALLASFMLAISPWSIQFSRVGFEANVGDSLNILMVLFFIKGLKNKWFLIFSAVCAGLCIYVYQSEKVFTPFLVLLLLIVFRKTLYLINKKFIFAIFLLGILIVLPMFLFILNNRQSLQRLSGTSILSNQNDLLRIDAQNLNRDILNKDKLGLILDNRRIVYTKTIVSNYISHFDSNWLFIKGDITNRHHAPGMGLLYLFEFPLILIGIYQLLFGEFNRKTKLILFGWWLLAPVPASITTGVPHAVRTLNFLPTWQIFSAIGIVSVVVSFSKYKSSILNYKIKLLIPVLVLYLLFASFNFAYYINQYFVQLNYYYSFYWQYGYKQAIGEIKKIDYKYSRIIVSNRAPLDQSYIYFLFYLKYPPASYQKEAVNYSGGFASNHYFDKYQFRVIDWKKDSQIKNALFVTYPWQDIPTNLKIIDKIYNVDGTVIMELIGT
jgi:4-amino-4-deoxy-L-arabinose transferase-like glycosyltransferase